MRIIEINLEDLSKKVLNIGREGEDNHVEVRINCAFFFNEYPDAVATMAVVPPVGDAYPVVVTKTGKKLIWDVKAADVANNGTGIFQLTFTDDEEIIKTEIGRFNVDISIEGDGEPPEPIADWLTEANEALADMEQALETIEGKLDAPETAGTAGQVLGLDSNLEPEWMDQEVPDGSMTEAKLSNALKLKTIKDYVTPEMYGAEGDGVTDDTIAIRDAVNSGYKLIIFSPKTYLVDPASFKSYTGYSTKIGIDIPSDVTIIGNGAKILVKQYTLDTTYAIFATANYRSANYEAGLPWQKNITIEGLTIDGNSLNSGNTHSLTGIAINKTENIVVDNIVITNMSGDDGAGYGIIFAYSKNAFFKNSSIDGSSRSNVYCWETQRLLCENLTLVGSVIRDCVTCGTNDTVMYQSSIMVMDNCKLKHEYQSGTHIIRFTGVTFATVRNCEMIGNQGVDGIAVPVTTGYAIDLLVQNCRVSNCTVGLNQTGSGADNVHIKVYDSQISGDNAIETAIGSYDFRNTKFRSDDNTKYMKISGNDAVITNCEFSHTSYINISSVILLMDSSLFSDITGQSNAYWVAVQSGTGHYAIITNNIFADDTKYIRVYCNGKLGNNKCKVLGATSESTNIDVIGDMAYRNAANSVANDTSVPTGAAITTFVNNHIKNYNHTRTTDATGRLSDMTYDPAKIISVMAVSPDQAAAIPYCYGGSIVGCRIINASSGEPMANTEVTVNIKYNGLMS